MLLIELFESLDDAHLQSLIKKLRDAKEELKAEKARAASVQQSGISSTHRNVVDRATHAVKAAEDEITAYKATAGATEKAREFEKAQTEKRSTETPEEKKKRLGQAMAAGHKKSAELRTTETGEKDWNVTAKKVHDYVVKASNHGENKVSADDIAHNLGGAVTARQINKWLERPEFIKTARLLGRK